MRNFFLVELQASGEFYQAIGVLWGEKFLPLY